MRRVYTGLLLFGASFASHAAEVHKQSHATKHAPAVVHYSPYVPDSNATNPAPLSGGLATPAVRGDVFDRATAELGQSQQRLVALLHALHDHRIALQNEQMRLSLQPGSAVMETDHLKVAVEAASASITWHKTF